MTLIRWSPALRPARDLVGMQDEVDRFVDSFFSRGPLRGSDTLPFTPAVDIEETPEAFVLRADLPGIAQKDVKVSLIGDALTLRGERRPAPDGHPGNRLREERVHGAFERTFTLGAPVRADQVKAIFRDGVLEVHVPKAEEARLREIQIQVG